jgi:hypothetical protein
MPAGSEMHNWKGKDPSDNSRAQLTFSLKFEYPYTALTGGFTFGEGVNHERIPSAPQR